MGVGRRRQQAAAQARSRLPAARHRRCRGAFRAAGFAGRFAILAAICPATLEQRIDRPQRVEYVDAQVRLSAAELNIASAHFAPAAIDATLAGGVLTCAISNLGAYGGQASGEVDIDVSGGNPSYAMRSDIAGMRALPLLRSTAGFDRLDGKMQARIAVRSTGSSQRAIMSNLGGTVFADFRDGAIRGLNVAQMIRALTSNPLSGWQQDREQTTDLTQLSASFRIDKGEAATADLNLVGPLVRMTGAGTIDLGAKTLSFRVEPKLVMTTEGQGRAADPVGFGVPVAIDGPWAEPRIYPDVAGMLDDPDAAYARSRTSARACSGPADRAAPADRATAVRAAAGCPTCSAASSARPWASCCSRDWAGEPVRVLISPVRAATSAAFRRRLPTSLLPRQAIRRRSRTASR